MKTLYLVAYYYQKPANNRVKTQLKDWMKKPNAVSLDEQVALTRNLKPKDISMAKIILDLGNKKVVRNNWNSDNSFEQLFLYFHKAYPQYTKDVMLQIDPEYYNSLFAPAARNQPVTTIDTSSTISSV